MQEILAGLGVPWPACVQRPFLSMRQQTLLKALLCGWHRSGVEGVPWGKGRARPYPPPHPPAYSWWRRTKDEGANQGGRGVQMG